MIPCLLRGAILIAAIFASTFNICLASEPKPCISPADAQAMLDKNICVSVHVYDVVQIGDGTRYLDVCAPDVSDDHCRFTVVSLRGDRDVVGELEKYRGTDLMIRGVISAMHGRSGMVLSHERQLHGGPPRLRPNPKLLRGFDGDRETPPIGDPNLRMHGSARSFMNLRDRVSTAR